MNEKCINASNLDQGVHSPIGKVPAKDINHLFELETKLRGRYSFGSIVSCHPQMIRVLKIISQVADTEATVLIQGESGTGKEIIAHSLHCNSSRKDKPFIPINCGAIPENLLESELFGHVRGAFTGATNDETGWFKSAEGGTILMDEVSEMSMALQVKLLRVLQTGEYSPVGSTKIRKCRVRILASTNKDLQKLVKHGKFRDDLYYRLNVIDIYLAPLRRRKCDIPILIQHFLEFFGSKYGKNNLRLTRDANALLLAYDFPGNVRELENIIHRVVVLAEGKSVEPRHFPNCLYVRRDTCEQGEKTVSTFKAVKKQVVEQFEHNYIINCLKSTGGNITHAAHTAGMNVKNFYEKMRKYGVDARSFKVPE